MATEKNIIKNWFITGAKPTQEQFWSWQDSYWHKNENLSIDNIEGLGSLIGQKADASQLAYFANKDASNIEVNTWKTKLGVGDLPSNIATVDEGEKTGNVYLKDQTYKKVQNPGDGKTYLLNIDGKAIAVDGLGESIYSSDGTTKEDRTLIQGKNFTWNTGGNPLFFKGLPNKDIDVKYNRFKVQDENGQEAYSNGISQFTNNIANATDAQKDAWRKAQLKSNEKYSLGRPRIDAVMPPVLDGNLEYVQYISLMGINLFVDNATPNATVKMKHVETEEEWEIENFQVLQNNPNTIFFGLDWSTYPKGEYIFYVLHNGIWSLENRNAMLRLNNKLEETNIPSLTWNQCGDFDNENDWDKLIVGASGFELSVNGISVNNKKIKTRDAIITREDMQKGVMVKGSITFIRANRNLAQSACSGIFGLIDTDKVLELITKPTYSVLLSGENYLKTIISYNPTSGVTKDFSQNIDIEDEFYIIIKDGILTMFFKSYGIVNSIPIEEGNYSLYGEAFGYKGPRGIKISYQISKKYKM